MIRARPRLAGLCLLGLATAASAAIQRRHEHHDEPAGPYEFNFTNEEELDSTIFLHATIQGLAWLILFPAGMVLGLTKSPFHAPLQAITCLISLFGNYLGHHHAGRSFHSTAHSHSSKYMWLYMITQAGMGVFLKLHVMEGTFARRAVVKAHSWVGKSFPVFGWMMAVFGIIAMNGFCFGEHITQCAAHGILGSGFVAYAIILVILMKVGTNWLAKRKVSQELIDSSTILVLGIVNTFTEHNFLAPNGNRGWNHKDMNHVSLGVLWWAGGILGVVLSRNGQRSVVPGIIIAMTGFAMAGHAQANESSTSVHKLFGAALGCAGLARVIEICFVLHDQPAPSTAVRAWQHVAPYFLALGGLTFMNGTEEEMAWLEGSKMDFTTFANGLFSEAFVVYAVACALVELFQRLSKPREVTGDDVEHGGAPPTHTTSSWLPAIFSRLPSFITQHSPTSQLGFSRPTRPATGLDGAGVEGYEAVPLTAASTNTTQPERGLHPEAGTSSQDSAETVFDLGEDEDDGGDDFWEEKERRRVARS